MVVLFVVIAIVIGVFLMARSSRTYDEIGGGIFDHPKGDHEDRYPPDAEGAEFMDALASYSAESEEDPREDASAGAGERATRGREPSRRAARRRRRSRGRE